MRGILSNSGLIKPQFPAEDSGMRAEVFQAVALCCHANGYLAGEAEQPPELLSNSTFRSVNEITFERPAQGKLAASVVADATAPWLRRIRKEGVEKVSLSLAGCPLDPLAAVSQPWGIVCDGDVGVEIWQPTWRKRLRSHSDPAPWRVLYTASRANRWQLVQAPAIEAAEKQLQAALRECSRLHASVPLLLVGAQCGYPDMYPGNWPDTHRDLGVSAAIIVDLLRSESWASLVDVHDLNRGEHAFASDKLWKTALSALEASVAVEHPMVQTLRPTG